MAEDQDEDDYMSDAILAKVEHAAATASAASGPSKVTKSHKLFDSSSSMPRNRQTDAQPVLYEGLAKPIEESNKGFKLLAKMGFTNDNSNKSEPIELMIKTSRAGLGVEEDVRKQARLAWREELDRMKTSVKQEDEKKAEYLRNHEGRFESRRMRGQLLKLRLAEANLREANSLGSTNEGNRDQIVSSDLGGRSSDGQMPNTNDAINRMLDSKLESTSADPSALELRDDTSEAEDKIFEPNSVEGENQYVEPDYAAIVKAKVKELRSHPFFYCFYCGHQYHDAEDLDANCPGESEDSH